MNKKILSIVISCILIIGMFSTTVSAAEKNQIYKYLPSVAETKSNDVCGPQRVPNGIPITVTARQDGTGVDVYVGNIGVDGLDSVTVTVTATGYTQPQSQTSYVPAILGKTFAFDFPYIKCNTTYNAIIRVVDGSGTRTLEGSAYLIWSESDLETAHWNRGSFSTRVGSLEHHLSQHGWEVGATNLVQYLNYANMYRSTVLYDISNGNTSNYIITASSVPTPGVKYKSRSNGQFIILANSDNGILSYGI